MAMDGDPTARVAVREIETIVRDGTACACARVGVVTASRVAPVVETHAAVAGDASNLPNAAREQSRARHDRKRRRTPGALDACARLRRVTATVHIAQSHAGDSRETTRLEAMTRDAFAMRASKGPVRIVVAVECVVRAADDESTAEAATRAARATCAALHAAGLNPTCADALFEDASSDPLGRKEAARVQVWALHLPEARSDGTPSRGPSSREIRALARLNVTLVDAFHDAGDASRER